MLAGHTETMLHGMLLSLSLLHACGEPTVANVVRVSPAEPRTTDDLLAVITDAPETPADGWSYEWQLDRVTTEHVGPTVPAAATSKGQEWTVVVRAIDGKRQGEPRAASVRIGNTPPVVEVVRLPDNPLVDLPLQVEVQGTDIDGDEVVFDFDWKINGEILDVDTATLPGAMVILDTDIRVEVAADDGDDLGERVSSNEVRVVRIPNDPVYAGYGFETLIDFGPMSQPSDLAVLPDGRLLVLGLGGLISVFDPTTDTLVDQLQIEGDARDAVSIALHPQFGDGEHDQMYIWRNKSTELLRFGLSLDPMVLSDRRVLFEAQKEATDGHSGGDLIWWDGETDEPVLYLTIGDGLPESGQDDSTVFGALVAFAEDEDGFLVPGVPQAAYANAYVTAIGVRNPWRLADCGPTLCMADVARDDWEELNIYEGTPANYGWSDVEGAPGDPAYIDPVFMYHHDEFLYADEDADNAGGLDVMKVHWVGVVVSDNAYGGALAGRLLHGDHYDGWIRGLPIGDQGYPVGDSAHVAHLRYVTSVVEAPDGFIYATDLSGTLRRMVTRDQIPMADDVGAALSDSPYYDPSLPAMGYTVRYPLYSNGSGKDRLLQLPPGTVIDNSDPNNWVFPDGTRVYKTFDVAGETIETRVIEKRGDRWVAGVYIHADDGDAYFSDGYVNKVETSEGTYQVPSIASCEECHAGTRGRDFPLGLERHQLGDEGLALLSGVLKDPPAPLPTPQGDALDQRVRGYLHGNCSYCHNQSGRSIVPDLVGLELDFDINAGSAHNMNAFTEVKYLFQTGTSMVIHPGDSDDSAILGIMEQGLMPPLGLWQDDDAFIEDLEVWIDRLQPLPGDGGE